MKNRLVIHLVVLKFNLHFVYVCSYQRISTVNIKQLLWPLWNNLRLISLSEKIARHNLRTDCGSAISRRPFRSDQVFHENFLVLLIYESEKHKKATSRAVIFPLKRLSNSTSQHYISSNFSPKNTNQQPKKESYFSNIRTQDGDVITSQTANYSSYRSSWFAHPSTGGSWSAGFISLNNDTGHPRSNPYSSNYLNPGRVTPSVSGSKPRRL